MTGIEPNAQSFQIARTTHWTTRATHTKEHHLNAIIFCTKSKLRKIEAFL